MSEEQADYLKDAMEMMGIDLSAPKEIVQEISGFTPLFDAVVMKYKDETRAAVHGAMWRFCQMADGVCRASLGTIAAMIGISPATAMRHVEELVKDGYFIDLTPDLKNRPHVYADSGVVKMKSRLDVHVSQRNTGISQRNAGVSESQLSKVLNKDNNKQGDVFPDPTPTKKQGDLVDGLLALAQSPGIKRQTRIDAILSATAEKLHIRTTGKRWEEFAKLADDRQQHYGESLITFLDWLTAQKGFSPQYWPPSRMAEFWPQAFISPTKSAPPVTYDENGIPESY